MRQKIVFFLSVTMTIGGYSPWCQAQQAQVVKEVVMPRQLTKDLELLDFANGLFKRDFFDMATDEYLKVIQGYPQSPYIHEAFFGLAECYFFQEDFAQAIKWYSQFLTVTKDQKSIVMAHLRLGQSFFAVDQFGQALSSLHAIKEEQVEQSFKSTYLFYLGKIFQALEDDKKAFQYFQQVVSVPTKGEFTAQSFFEMGVILTSQKSYQKSLELFSQAAKAAETDQLKTIALFKQGEVQFLAENYAGSLGVFKKLLKQHSDNVRHQDIIANILLAYFNLAQYEDVVKAYRKHEKDLLLNPIAFDLYFVVANAYIELRQDDVALNIIDRLLSLEITEEQEQKAASKKAQILMRRQDYEGAVAQLESLSTTGELYQDHILYLKAESLYQLRDFAAAFELYKQLAEQYPDSSFADDALYSAAYSQKALAQIPAAIECFRLYYEKGKDEVKREEALYNDILLNLKTDLGVGAVESCELYLKDYPRGSHKENVLFILGSLYPKKNEFVKAIDVLKLFLTHFPQSVKREEAIFLIGYYYQTMQQYDQSLVFYGQLTPSQDADGVYLSSLKNTASIYLTQGVDRQAARTFDKIVMGFENHGLKLDTYLWVAEQYMSQQEFINAQRILKKADERQDNADIFLKIKYFLAESYRQTKSFNKAIKCYSLVLDAVENERYQSAAYIGQGLSYKQQKQYTQAAYALEQAILSSSADHTTTIQARFELASIKELEGQLDEALKLYMLVAVLYKDEKFCEQALFKAGKIFEKQGQRQKALKTYQELMEKYPSNQYYEETQEKIKYLSAP
ncbi:MAG: tetratricopeptide repeat protein [Candidatus Omnitrophica bacterium]|nr:tetratricopeptide repeat protein [Candidatus Omnitrophota bacterium]